MHSLETSGGWGGHVWVGRQQSGDNDARGCDRDSRMCNVRRPVPPSPSPHAGRHICRSVGESRLRRMRRGSGGSSISSRRRREQQARSPRVPVSLVLTPQLTATTAGSSPLVLLLLLCCSSVVLLSPSSPPLLLLSILASESPVSRRTGSPLRLLSLN